MMKYSNSVVLEPGNKMQGPRHRIDFGRLRFPGSLGLLFLLWLVFAGFIPSRSFAQTPECAQDVEGDFVVGRTTGEVFMVTAPRTFPGRIIVKNRGLLHIHDTNVQINGNVLVCDNSRVKIERSVVTINMRYFLEREFVAYNGSTFDFTESFFINDNQLPTSIILQSSRVTMDLVNRVDRSHAELAQKIAGWTTSMLSSSTTEIRRTYYHGECTGFLGNSVLNFEDSLGLMLWINIIEPNSGGIITPPSTEVNPISWTLSRETQDVQGIDYTIVIQNSTFINSGVLAWIHNVPNANLTIKDGYVAIGLIFINHNDISIGGFKERFYDEFNPTLPRRQLRLQNVRVWNWSVYSRGSTVNITDSEIGEIFSEPVPGRDTHVTVRRSKLVGNGGQYRATNPFRVSPPPIIEIIDCDVYSNLTATNRGEIKLISSRMFESGRGAVAGGASLIANNGTVSLINSVISSGVESTLVGNGTITKAAITPAITIRADGTRVVTFRGDASVSSRTQSLARYTIAYAPRSNPSDRTQIYVATTPVRDGILYTWNVPDSVDPGNYIVTLTVYDSTGSLPYEASRAVHMPDRGGAIPYTILGNGVEGIKTTGAAGDSQVGSMVVSPDRNVAFFGAAIVSLTQDGTVTTETAMPDAPPSTKLRAFVAADQQTDTTIAIANPGAETGVRLTLLSNTGSVLGEASLRLPASGQISQLVRELIASAPATFQGSLRIESDQPVAAVALKQFADPSGASLLSALPVANENAPSDARFLILPHLTDGNGTKTQIILMNTTSGMLTGQVYFYSATGDSLAFTIGGRRSSVFPYTIGPNGTLTLTTDGTGGSAQLGYALIEPSSSGQVVPYAGALFSAAQDGAPIWEAGYSSPTPIYQARTLIELSERINPGMTMVNPNDNAATVTLSLKTSDGVTEIARGTVTVPPRGMLSQSLNQMLDIIPGTFRGILDIATTNSIHIVGMRNGITEKEDLLYVTTLPVVDMENPPRRDSLILPYMIDGAGFRTQMLAMNLESAATSGSILFLSSDGDLQPVEFTSLY